MKELTQIEHRSRMTNGVKFICQACKSLSVVDSCDNKECSLSFWISTLHRQKMFDVSDLAADICRYCYGKCSYTYPVCQNHSQVAAQCKMFIAKESAVTVPGSKSGLSEHAVPVVPIWKDEPCQK